MTSNPEFSRLFFDLLGEIVNNMKGINISSPGETIFDFAEFEEDMTRDGLTETEIITNLIGSLYDGLKKGNWPK